MAGVPMAARISPHAATSSVNERAVPRKLWSTTTYEVASGAGRQSTSPSV